MLHTTPLHLFSTCQIFMAVIFFILFSVFGLSKVCLFLCTSPYAKWALILIDLRKKKIWLSNTSGQLCLGAITCQTPNPLWHPLCWKWHRIFHANIFSKFLLNHLHIGFKYSLCTAQASFWHRRDRTALICQPFINIIQLLHFYKQCKQIACGFLQYAKDLGKSSLLIFPSKCFRFLLFEITNNISCQKNTQAN